MRDFTINTYSQLLKTLIDNRYVLMSFSDFFGRNSEKIFILRHDVDRKPWNSLNTARMQSELGVRGTYYFRIVPESFQPKYIEAIAALGHEIGYHYEDLTICKGDFNKAIDHFEKSLEALRKYAPVSTICMHGSPMTKWDNRDIWKKYSYKDYGISAEPYFDIDFKELYYLTDTGRRWDGDKVSIRDKVPSHHTFSVHSTFDLIKAIKNHTAPEKIMQNIHPERWTDSQFEWIIEFSKSAVKNPVKKALSTLRS